MADQEPKLDSYIIRKAEQMSDLHQMAEINRKVFAGSGNIANGLEWIYNLWKSGPIYQYYVIKSEHDQGTVLGYSGWQVHGGFDRIEPTIELDQIGIATFAQGKGLGEKLIRSCITQIAPWIATRSSRCGGYVSFIVWGYCDNAPAMRLYGKIFTEGVCGIRTQFENREEFMHRLRVPIGAC